MFLSYFPGMAWLILFAALLLKYAVPEIEPLFNLIITFTVIYLFFKLRTIIHECGHLVAGYWAGAIPKRMILGTGHEVYRTEWRGVKIVLKSIPIGGMAIALFNELPFIRLRFAFFIVGGVLFNLLAALICYLLFGFDSSFLSAAHSTDFASCFIFANLLGITNLIPFYTSYYGTSTPTDGLLLLQTLFGSYKKNFQNLKYSEDYFQAFEYFENREYDKASNLYQALHEKIPEELTALSMMATILIKQCQPDEALPLLTTLEGRIESKELKKHKGIIYNNIAWTYLLKNNIETAYDYASRAIKAMPKNKVVGGTYGSVLIEGGKIDIGMQWVATNVDTKHLNDTTLAASIYMMLGFHLKKDFAARDKHLHYVQKHENMLEKDSSLIWKRNLEKISKETNA